MTLGVQLVGDRDIVVISPDSGFSITYRKEGDAPLLFAINGMDRADEPAKVRFWAQAWKAAHQKACALGWLRS